MAYQIQDNIVVYPGCLAAVRFPEYEASAYRVLAALGYHVSPHKLQLCCGSTVVDSIFGNTPLPAIILSAAEGLEIITLCGSCTNVLTRAAQVQSFYDPEISASLGALGLSELLTRPSVHHVHEAIWQRRELISNLIRQPLSETAVLSIPCQIGAPAGLYHDAGLSPAEKMTSILAMLGLNVAGVAAGACCGSSLAMTDRRAADEIANARFSSIAPGSLVVDTCANCRSAAIRIKAERYGLKFAFLTEIILEAISDDQA